MRPVGVAKNEKKDRNFHASNWLFAQTTHVDVGPWNFACGVMSGKWLYISSFMKIGRGVSELWRSKVALSHWIGPWLIQQLVVPYKPWSKWGGDVLPTYTLAGQKNCIQKTDQTVLTIMNALTKMTNFTFRAKNWRAQQTNFTFEFVPVRIQKFEKKKDNVSVLSSFITINVKT